MVVDDSYILQGFTGLQVASHPNIYVLDTPGVLSSRFTNDDFVSRLALTGTNYCEVYAFTLTTFQYC